MAYVGTPSYLGSAQATLASIIAGEAADQGLIGQQAVGAVISNRASQWGGTPLSQALAPNQFQGQASGGYGPGTTAWSVAGDVLNGTNPDPTGGALYYANPGASSASWARNLNPSNSVQIGSHYFTDNTQGVPFSGSGSAVGYGDGTNIAGNGNMSIAGDNSAPPSYDLSQFQVAGVNTPYDYASQNMPAPSYADGTGASPSAAAAATGTGGFGGSGPGQVQTSGTPSGPLGDTQTSSPSNQPGDWTTNGVVAVANAGAAVANSISGAATTATNGVTTWLNSWLDNVTSWFTRGAGVLFGLVLIIIAGFLLMRGSKS